MKLSNLVALSTALFLTTSVAQAQSTPELDQLKKQVQQMQENFDRIQREQKQQIEALQKQLEALGGTPTRSTPHHDAHGKEPEAEHDHDHDDHDHAQDQKKRGVDDVAHVEHSDTDGSRWHPTDSIHLGHEDSFVDISLIGTFALGGSTADDIGALQAGGHDPNQNGFSVQGLDLSLSGVLTQNLRGNANVLFGIDGGGETYVELEEGWLETGNLPGNLQLRAGQILSEFGRQNVLHPHAWSFVDSSLVNARFLGADGLRNPGLRLSWHAPTPFHSDLFLSIQNSGGATAAGFRSSGAHTHGEEEGEALPFGFRHSDNDRGVNGVEDLLFAPRYVASFALSDSQQLIWGTSAAFGPNASGDSGDNNTQIYGVDFAWKWKPSSERGVPFVTWETEAMLRKYDVGAFDWDESGNGGDGDGDGFVDEGSLVNGSTGLPAALARETLTDYGFYTQLLYGFRKDWIAGLRFDYVTGERGNYESLPLLLSDGSGAGTLLGRDPLRNERWRISPNLTWFPTDYSKLRLQYNYDHRQGLGIDHSVWLQFEFALGSHPAH